MEAGELTEEQVNQLVELSSHFPESGRYESLTDDTCRFAKPRFEQDVSCAEDAANCAVGLTCAQDIQDRAELENV